jgi:hypothetical protein
MGMEVPGSLLPIAEYRIVAIGIYKDACFDLLDQASLSEILKNRLISAVSIVVYPAIVSAAKGLRYCFTKFLTSSVGVTLPP